MKKRGSGIFVRRMTYGVEEWHYENKLLISTSIVFKKEFACGSAQGSTMSIPNYLDMKVMRIKRKNKFDYVKRC
jgi:hypothetical protein